MTKTRRALVENRTVELKEIQAYLPANYTARYTSEFGGERIVIEGIDNAGWTLDAYVIPRLGSGLIVATEVSQ